MNELMTLRTISYLMVTLALGVFVLLRMSKRRPQNRILKLLAVGMLFLLFGAVVAYFVVLCSVIQ